MENYLLRPTVVQFIYKPFHTASCLYGKQAARAMKKVVCSTSKRKSAFYQDTPILPSQNIFSNGAFGGNRSGTPKRASMLNKLFMRHITDLMATGECSNELVGLGIEVNRVKVSSNYKNLSVYWVAKGNDNDEVIHKVLDKNAGLLRHELSQLRVMGVVPYIEFIKDKTYSLIAEVDNKLTKADFGEDHEFVDGADKLRAELEMFGSYGNNTVGFKNIMEHTQVSDDDIDLPPMPQNVMGLDHASILKRIVKNMSRNKRKVMSRDELLSPLQSINEDPVEYKSRTEQRDAFRQFLRQREIMRMKGNGDKKHILDTNFAYEDNREEIYVEESFEEDFIIEDIDYNNEER